MEGSRERQVSSIWWPGSCIPPQWQHLQTRATLPHFASHHPTPQQLGQMRFLFLIKIKDKTNERTYQIVVIIMINISLSMQHCRHHHQNHPWHWPEPEVSWMSPTLVCRLRRDHPSLCVDRMVHSIWPRHTRCKSPWPVFRSSNTPVKIIIYLISNVNWQFVYIDTQLYYY